MPAGRPTKYDPAFCEQVEALGREGKSRVQIAAALNVSRSVLDVWAEAHPQFMEALTRAKDFEQAWWEDAAMTGKAGDTIHPSVWAKSVAARFRNDYTERQEVTGKDGGPLQVQIVRFANDSDT